MAVAQLFFREPNLIGNIELDVIITESAQSSARITRNPVQSGSDINDHMIIDPMTFSMQGVVSNASISATDTAQSVISLISSGGQTRDKITWDQLLELQASRIPFTLFQNLRSYDNVVIQSLREAQDKDTSNGLFFVADMVALNIVGVAVITADQFEDQDTADGMLPATEGGLKQIGQS